MDDEVFSKVEKKTNVKKEEIMRIASKLNEGNMKDPTTIKEIISELSLLTGKEVKPSTEEKIINLILEDKVPKSIDKLF